MYISGQPLPKTENYYNERDDWVCERKHTKNINERMLKWMVMMLLLLLLSI